MTSADRRAEDRQVLERVFYLAEHLLQQVPEFTGVISPDGHKEDDYIRDSIGQELVDAKARLAAALDELAAAETENQRLRDALHSTKGTTRTLGGSTVDVTFPEEAWDILRDFALAAHPDEGTE